MLKTLEEPSPGNIIILISTSVQRQLPTIRSRSQVVRFQPLSDEDVAANLVDLQMAASKEQAIEMAARGTVASPLQYSYLKNPSGHSVTHCGAC